MDKLEFNSVEELEERLVDFKILFAYHSNKIENPAINYHDTREIFENGKIFSFTGDLRTIFEISNQKDCFNMLAEHIVRKDSITIDLVKKIHYELTKGTYDERRYNVNKERPGEFKKTDYGVGRMLVGSSPEDVESDLEILLEEINNYEGDNYITVAAYFHASFENIHPFSDGNGRVGRTLMNYYLLINRMKPLIVFDEDKKYYYACLDKFDTDEDISSLCEFIKYEQEKTWQRRKNEKNYSLKSFIDQCTIEKDEMDVEKESDKSRSIESININEL